MTLNIAAIPFLWVLPLALYLLSFVLCFEASGWYRRWLFLPLLAAGLAGVCVTLTRSNPSIWALIPLYCATLFAACMVCHGELARSKPHPQHLTGFYLMLALGGAAGGVLVGLVAPNLFRDLYELPIGMLALSLLVIAALLRDRASLFHGRFGIAARVVFLALTAALGVALVRTRSEFTFLKDSPAKVEVALGDARLSLEREPPGNFDVLALDAFSSDAIPVHLLTVEAFKTYLRHLKQGGILAVHISNRYLDLVPVVQQAARHLSLEVRQVANDDDDDAGE